MPALHETATFPSISKAIKGLKIHTVAGDGNCFYRAVAKAHFDNEDLHYVVRQTIMDYLRDHAAEYQVFFDSPAEYAAMIAKNRKEGVWNSDIADMVPAIFANVFGVCIQVFTVSANKSVSRYTFGPYSPRKPSIRLLLNSHHYNLLV
jgi:hypothetical protein